MHFVRSERLTDILFYHLEQMPLEKVLPQLLEKTLERGWNAVIEVGDDDRAEALDASLWTWNDESFLPHGMTGSDFDAQTPILLTTNGNNPNAAAIRFFVGRAVPDDIGDYQRLVFMFDGHDPDAVAEARQAWKALKPDNDCTYWQQEASGKWAKKG